MSEILAVVIGASLATLGGLIGAWVQGRREHARWIREQRYQAYVDIVAVHHDQISASIAKRAAKEFGSAVGATTADRLQDDVNLQLPRASAALAIVGPAATVEAAGAVHHAILFGDDAEQISTRNALLLAMRKTLNISSVR
ncbi:hypothetical protein [Microbacterium aquilitoris]|uniref:hypothetical protein n=1 Tax=Microbacterium aquilitoris TaxID=3067307 RepID=UPI00288E9D09|nr:hypothetical protein [Microbacterium sp. KSW2-22]MDT3343874.1 hypothetical protein [Microbacterium sp. KSW2-22]